MKQNHIKKYRGFIKGGTLTFFSYKFNIYMWLVGTIISVLCTVLLWYAVYNNDLTIRINGLTFYEMVTYIVTVNVVCQFIYSSDTFWFFGKDIRNGDIAINLTKPINYRSRLYASAFGSLIGSAILLFLPLYILSMLILHYTIGTPFPIWYNILFFLVSCILSHIIIDSFDFTVGSLAYFTGALFGIFIIRCSIVNFLSGSLIPISYFPDWLAYAVRILPFSSMAETPTYIILNYYGNPDIIAHDPIAACFANNPLAITGVKLAIQFSWTFVLLGLSYLINSLGNKHVVSVGG